SSWIIVTHTPVTRQTPRGTTRRPAMSTAAAPSAHSSFPSSRSSRPAPTPLSPELARTSIPSPPRVPGPSSPHTLPAPGEATLDGTVYLDVLDHAPPHLPLELVRQPVLDDPQLRRPRRRRGAHDQRGRFEPLDDAVRGHVRSHQFRPATGHLRDVQTGLPSAPVRQLREEPAHGPRITGIRPGPGVGDLSGTTVRIP